MILLYYSVVYIQLAGAIQLYEVRRLQIRFYSQVRILPVVRAGSKIYIP
jgi:hypothetical protein